ncbi:MAG: hypothetical protein QOF62_2456 [Pyrinomonadaceae bacterium]|jgi:hypothetical protein|nr:hypothetical protein [Pyrinomonadaceae bacterium]
MNHRRYLVVLCLGAALLFLPARTFAQCGGERWSVKIGSDPDAGLVNLSNPTPTTLAALTALAAPNPIPDNKRVQPTETTVWVITATLKQYQKQADSDYHLLLIDGAGHQMIAEIPSPNCVAPGSPFAAGVSRARAQFEAKFTATSALKNANVPVQITGVGFFDYLAGQTGVAPNGIEIHPILDIVFNPTNDFSLTASSSTLNVAQGSSVNTTIATSTTGSFNSSIALAASGLPAGTTAGFNPSSIAAPGSGSSTLTINVGSTTPTGTYNISITGSGGGKTHNASITLTVGATGGASQQLLGNPGFENGANAAPWVVSAGVLDNTTLQPSRTGAWKAWMNGFGSPHTDTLSQTITIPANATRATLSYWLYVYTAETTASVAYDTLAVQLRNSSGAVLTTLTNYSNLSPKFPYAQASFDLTSYKGQTIQLYLVGTEDQGLQTSFLIDDFSLDVATTSTTIDDFSIAAAPGTLSAAQGSSASTSISTTISGSFNSTVSLVASGLPTGTTAGFNPSSIAAPGSGSSTLNINVGSTTPPGTYNISVTGSGGGKSHSTNINLTISAAGGTAQQLLGNPSFENGASASPWVATTGVIDNTTLQPARTGAWKAWMNGWGSSHTDTLAQTVTIPANAANATLSYWIYVYTAETSPTIAYDKLVVQVRSSSGAVLATLANYSNLSPKFPYAQASFDLGSYKGQTIQIYLVGTEDQGLQTSFIIDDFSLDVIQ